MPTNSRYPELLPILSIQKRLKGLIKRLRGNFERQLVQNLPEIPKAFWRYVHSRQTTRTRVDELVTENGNMACTVAAKTRALAEAYNSVY